MHNMVLLGEVRRAVCGLASQLWLPGRAVSLQMDGEIKEKQTSTLIICVGALEWGGGGIRGVQPKIHTRLQRFHMRMSIQEAQLLDGTCHFNYKLYIWNLESKIYRLVYKWVRSEEAEGGG
eukprot:1138640-Pelagomonas_calceolata.AAC.8